MCFILKNKFVSFDIQSTPMFFSLHIIIWSRKNILPCEVSIGKPETSLSYIDWKFRTVYFLSNFLS